MNKGCYLERRKQTPPCVGNLYTDGQWRGNERPIGRMCLSQLASTGDSMRGPHPHGRGPAFLAAELKDSRPGCAWALELGRCLLLWALFPPVVEAALCDRTARTRKKNTGPDPLEAASTKERFFYIYGICVCERQGALTLTCGRQRTTCGELTLPFHMGSRDQTQVSRHSALLG